MKDFEALKNIWNGQVERPKVEYDDVIRNFRKTKRRFSNKLLMETGGMFAGILIFLFIWLNNPFMMWTTHLSLLIFMVCCLYYVFVQVKDYRSLSNSESLLQQPDQYIVYLKKYQHHRYILNTRKYVVYSIFIGLAFGLYFIELYYVAPLWQTMLGVLFTAAWFVVCWRLMRSYMEREQERLRDMVDNLERLQKQFD